MHSRAYEVDYSCSNRGCILGKLKDSVAQAGTFYEYQKREDLHIFQEPQNCITADLIAVPLEPETLNHYQCSCYETLLYHHFNQPASAIDID